MEALTLEHLSAMKIAVTLCNDAQLKTYMIRNAPLKLCERGTCGHVDNSFWAVDSMFDRKLQFLMNFHGIPRHLQKDVFKLVQRFANNMLTWCVYHRVKFDLPNEYIVRLFTKSLLLNSRGEFSTNTAIEILVNDESLSPLHRYKVACGYLMTNLIHELWEQLSVDDKKSVDSLKMLENDDSESCRHQSQLPKLWAHYLSGKLLELLQLRHGGHDQSVEDVLWRHAFQLAIVDGNAAAENCAWGNLSVSDQAAFLVKMAWIV